MTDGLREAYDGLADLDLDPSNHLDRVEAADGTPFRVLVDADGEARLVHADVVEYEGWLGHPMTDGLLGFLALLGGLFVPVLIGLTGYLQYTGLAAYMGPVAGVVGGWVVAAFLLRTRVGDGLYRFLEYNDHKHLIEAAREAGGVP